MASYTIKSFTCTKFYDIIYDEHKEYYTCSCPDFYYRRQDNNEYCKHIGKVKRMDDNNASEYDFACESISVITAMEQQGNRKRVRRTKI